MQWTRRRGCMRPLFWLIFADPPVVETSYSQELTVVMLSAEALVHLHARISASLYHEETPCRRRSPSRSSALCASTAIGPISWVDACATFFWDANPPTTTSRLTPRPNKSCGFFRRHTLSARNSESCWFRCPRAKSRFSIGQSRFG